MRSESDHLQDPADQTLLNETSGVNGALDAETVAKKRQIFSTGFARDLPGACELSERGEGRFVGQVVLARFHDLAPNVATFRGNRRGSDELHPRVIQYLRQAAGDSGLRKFTAKVYEPFRIRIEYPRQCSARCDQPSALIINMRVIEMGGREQ